MAKRLIVKVPDPILSKKCREVDKFDERLWTLLDDMGFTNEQVEEFAEKAQENYSDAYGTYGLDAVFKLRQSNLNLSGASFCNGVAFVTVESEIACNSSEICG